MTQKKRRGGRAKLPNRPKTTPKIPAVERQMQRPHHWKDADGEDAYITIAIPLEQHPQLLEPVRKNKKSGVVTDNGYRQSILRTATFDIWISYDPKFGESFVWVEPRGRTSS